MIRSSIYLTTSHTNLVVTIVVTHLNPINCT